MKKILFLFILVLTACGLGGAPSGPQQAAEEETFDDYYVINTIDINQTSIIAETRDYLRLSMRPPITLNPLLNEDVTVARILGLIFEPLITLNENFRHQSHLANVELASDFSSAVITIRSDAFWSDGQPVTAGDLIFSIETLRAAPAGVIYRSNIENIGEVTYINSRTVQVAFIQSSASAVNMLNFPIIPRHHYEGNLAETHFNPLGNGTYMFSSFAPTRNIRLEASPTTFRPLPLIEEIEVAFLPNDQTELYAFNQGQIDAINLPMQEWIRHHSVRDVNYQTFPAMYFEFVGFNFNNEIFSNLQTRQNIAMAFDARSAAESIYLTHGVHAPSPIHPNSWAVSHVPGLVFNPEQRINIPDTLVIVVNEDNPQRVAIARRLSTDLTRAGADVLVDVLPYGEYFARIETGEFDLFIGGVNLSFVPEVQLFFRGGLFITISELEPYFTAMRLQFSEASYIQAVTNFSSNFAERVPVIGLAFRHCAVITNARVHQNNPPFPDNVFGRVNEWYILPLF